MTNFPSSGAEAAWQLFVKSKAYQALRDQARLIASLVPGFSDLEPSEQEAFIDELIFIESLTVPKAAAALAGWLSRRSIAQAEQPSNLPERPNVLFDWAGVERAAEKWLFVLLRRIRTQMRARAWDEVFDRLLRAHEYGMRGFDSLGQRKTNEFWRVVVRWCLPQWSKGRKDQPDNKRLQRRPPRNAAGKPHRSPLGQEW